MVELEFPTCLPAVLVGVDALRPELTDEVQWAHSVRHQHGGYACLQAQFYGVLLPLAAVPVCEPLMLGFEALAEDTSNRHAFAANTDLKPVHLTSGRPYHRGQLDVLQAFLSQANFKFPPLARGTEALLEFGEVRPDIFVGWPLYTVESPRATPVDNPEGLNNRRPNCSSRVLSQSALARLEELVGAPLRTYLLWENSD
jgi:hypothetical protein